MTEAAGSPPPFRAIKRVSPTQEVREQLLAAIESGEYQPGSLLPSERLLCESFGVSRVSVREAIAGLEAMGLVTVQHGRGAFVRESVNDQYAGPFGAYLEQNRAQLIELLGVRGALDELAAEEASLHGTSDGLTDLTSALAAFSHAVRLGKRDFGELAQLDVAFHLAIARAAGGQLLPRLLDDLNEILDESRRMTLSVRGQLDRSVKQHQVIADAIFAGDVKRARRAANLHTKAIREWVRDLDKRTAATSA
ncbi:MAG: FadR/GntR family transcriptional regulator, partial [Nocardioidaceae bacterium]